LPPLALLKFLWLLLAVVVAVQTVIVVLVDPAEEAS
jgi:hypothetical protein